MKLESEEYPYCQLNETETTNLSPDGKVLSKSKSLMINLRNEKPEIVYKNYLKLKQLIDGKKDGPEKKEQKENNPGLCPKCGAALIHRSGISKKGVVYDFLGCSSYPLCRYSRNIPDKEEMPADEDLMLIEE